VAKLTNRERRENFEGADKKQLSTRRYVARDGDKVVSSEGFVVTFLTPVMRDAFLKRVSADRNR
jgi:hypothetical protein